MNFLIYFVVRIMAMLTFVRFFATTTTTNSSLFLITNAEIVGLYDTTNLYGENHI